MSKGLSTTTSEEKQEKKIDTISDEEIEDAMRPYSYEEKLERLKVSEADPVVYMHEDVKKNVIRMAQMKTYWKRKALAKYKSITLWYKKKMGLSAANKFVQGINDVVVLLEQNPHWGKEEPELKAYKRNYRSFVEHRNHKIIYYIKK